MTSANAPAFRFALQSRRRALGALTWCALSALALGCKRTPELPVLGEIPAFAFTDQAEAPFTQENMQGRVSVVAFMFTRCPTICPRITTTMRELQKRAQAASLPVHWLSFTVDPDNDTPAVLREYAKEYELDLSNWSLLTGDHQRIREVAEQGFKIGAEGKADPSAADYGISHGSHLVLVDQQGRIRGYYRTMDGDAQNRLLQDAERLLP